MDSPIDSDEKEAKIRRTEDARRKILCFLFVFLLLAFVGVGVGQSQHEHAVRGGLSDEGDLPGVGKGSMKRNGMKDPAVAKPAASATTGGGHSLAELISRVESLDSAVRAHKSKPGMVMEVDSVGLKLTKELQHETHRLLVARYGATPKRVLVDLIFPETMPDYTPETRTAQFTIEMAPHELIPCSVFYFLEIARTWKSGAFHRNANHVLQVQSHSSVHKSMPFQEYSPEFPHRKFTTGYAGRPSGPGWYVSILDNTSNHGPGSQQKHNPYEADSNFGSVVSGSQDVIPRIHSVPQKSWLDDKNKIRIPKLTILTPKYSREDANKIDAWVPWEDHDGSM